MAVVDDKLAVQITAGVVVDQGSITRAQAQLRQGLAPARVGGAAGFAFRPATEGLGRVRQVLDRSAKPAGQLARFLDRIRTRATETWHLGGLGRAAERLGDITTQAKSAGEQLGKLGGLVGLGGLGALGAGLAGGALGAMMTGFAGRGAELQRTSAATGISPRDLQMWRQAATRAGLAPEAATGALTGLTGLQYAARQGLAEAAPAISAAKQLNIPLEMLRGGDPTKFLELIAQKMVGQAPQVKQRIAEAFRVQDLFGLLEQGPEAVRRYLEESSKIIAVQDADIKKAQELQNALAGAGAATDKFATTIESHLSPALTPMLQKYSLWLGELAKSPAAMDAVSIGAGTLATVFGVTLVSAISLAIVRLNAFWALPAIKGLWALRGVLGTLGAAVALGVPLGEKADELWRRTHPADPNAKPPAGWLKQLDDWAKAGLGFFGIHPTGEGAAGAARPGAPPSVPKLPPAVGKERMQQGMNYFVGRGYTPAQAAGIMANLDAESGLREHVRGDNGAAIGLGQWHGDRQALFRQLYGHPLEQSSYAEQLAFVDWELKNSESKAGGALRLASGARSAGALVSADYERPADQAGEMERRGARAEAILSEYRPGPAVPTEPAGGAVLPTAVASSAPSAETAPSDLVSGMYPTAAPAAAAPAMASGMTTPVEPVNLDTSHTVEVRFLNAPGGTRFNMSGRGPADLQLRTQYAMQGP